MKHKITLISVLLIACLASSSGICDWEAHLAWVNEFNEPGRCPCDGCDDVPYMDNYANYLDAKLDDYGYDWTGVSANMGAELREWADSEYVGDGQDHVYHVGVDAADLGFIITHGGLRYSADTDDVAIGSYVRMGAPDDGDSSNCRLDYGQGYTDDNALRDVRWGDSALNYMILNSCNSLDWFAFGYTNAYEHGDMRSPDLALINGYHGVAQAGSTEYSHFQGFVDNVQYNGIGEEWVDRMTIYRSGDDMCGVSVVYADNSADSEHIYQYGGFKDLQTSYIGTSANAYYWYMTNCNPAGRGPTPSI